MHVHLPQKEAEFTGRFDRVNPACLGLAYIHTSDVIIDYLTVLLGIKMYIPIPLSLHH